MLGKPDWEEVQARWEALWEGRGIGRPLMSLRAPRPPDERVEGPVPADLEARWMDPETVVGIIEAGIQNTCWLGESIPGGLTMADWCVTCQPATPQFEPATIWFDPIEIDPDDPPELALSMDHPLVRRREAVRERLVERAGRDRFLVGQPCLMPPADALSLTVGTEMFLMLTSAEPEWTEKTLARFRRLWLDAHERFYEMARGRSAYPYGNAGWCPFWAPERFVTTQCDVACMISREAFDRFALPELRMLDETVGAIWYHLDGPDMIRHLDSILSIDAIRVIQWVRLPGGVPNGEGWADLYRRIQDAGRILHIHGMPGDDFEWLARSLDPSRLVIDYDVPDARTGEELIASMERWCAVKG